MRHDRELQDLFQRPSILMEISIRRMKWAGYARTKWGSMISTVIKNNSAAITRKTSFKMRGLCYRRCRDDEIWSIMERGSEGQEQMEGYSVRGLVLKFFIFLKQQQQKLWSTILIINTFFLNNKETQSTDSETFKKSLYYFFILIFLRTIYLQQQTIQ